MMPPVRMVLKRIKGYSYNLVFFPMVLRNSRPDDLKKKYPVYIFHHIPKCAGTSMVSVLRRWFLVVKDYMRYGHLEELPYFIRHPVNIDTFRSHHCLCGHFALPETHLQKRYPQVWQDKDFKIFTFIRDPLEVKISLYYHEKKRGQREGISLTQHLLERENYIASVLDCTLENYKEVLDRYFFIGITEHLQASMDKLAALLNKRKVKIPVLNLSQRDSQVSNLPPGMINRFKAANELDYRIYNYCLTRFRQTL
jgi:hypothetical protein